MSAARFRELPSRKLLTARFIEIMATLDLQREPAGFAYVSSAEDSEWATPIPMDYWIQSGGIFGAVRKRRGIGLVTFKGRSFPAQNRTRLRSIIERRNDAAK